MNNNELVWVEMDFSREWRPGRAIRIFRSYTAAAFGTNVQQMKYGEAVKDIRHQLFLRSKGNCEQCGSIVSEDSGHMHERQHRGKGGEISLANSIFICPKCHKYDHRDREPKFNRRQQ